MLWLVLMALVSLRKPASWVVRHRETGRLLETFDERRAELFATDPRFEVVDILTHLASLNSSAKVQGA